MSSMQALAITVVLGKSAALAGSTPSSPRAGFIHWKYQRDQKYVWLSPKLPDAWAGLQIEKSRSLRWVWRMKDHGLLLVPQARILHADLSLKPSVQGNWPMMPPPRSSVSRWTVSRVRRVAYAAQATPAPARRAAGFGGARSGHP